jgi:anti-sigma B factor antagonist
MQLQTESNGDILIVTPTEDRLDAAVAVQFKDSMRAVAATAPERVVLDLARVSFLDSSGLGAVIGAMKLLAPASRLELAGLTPPVEKVFKLTRMDRIFTIHADIGPIRGEATDACRAT